MGDSNKLQLYSYHRSSCAFRVRIGLNLKGLEYEYKAVNLPKGEQNNPGNNFHYSLQVFGAVYFMVLTAY
nr:glutathione S-transferase zeta class-like [Tanacetum cinerariifolium]